MIINQAQSGLLMTHDPLTNIVAEKYIDGEIDEISPPGQVADLESDIEIKLEYTLETELYIDNSTSTPSEWTNDLLKDYLRRAGELYQRDPAYNFEQSKKIESARNEVIRTCFYDAQPLAYPALFLVVQDIGSADDDDGTPEGIGGLEHQVDLLRKLDTKITGFGVALSQTRKNTLEQYLQESVRIAQALPLHIDHWKGVCSFISSPELAKIAYKRRVEADDIRRMEKSITTALQEHDKYVVNLMEANLLLVVDIAKHYQHRGLELMELIQEGNFGLKIGAERFDYKQGNKFSTYARWSIKQNIQRALSNKSRIIRLPVHIVDNLYKLNVTTKELSKKFGREPTTDEIAESMDFSIKKIKNLRAASNVEAETILDAPGMDEARTTLVDRAAYNSDFESADGVERLFSIEMKEKLGAALDTLKPIEADIILQHFGEEDQTLKCIGDKYNLSRERIRQLKEKALTKLKRYFESKEPIA